MKRVLGLPLRRIPRRPFQLATAGAMVLLQAGCSKPLSPQECNALLDRYVDMLARSRTPDASVEDILELQARARREAASDREFSRCATKVSRSQFECAMSAPDVDKLEQCLL